MGIEKNILEHTTKVREFKFHCFSNAFCQPKQSIINLPQLLYLKKKKKTQNCTPFDVLKTKINFENDPKMLTSTSLKFA